MRGRSKAGSVKSRRRKPAGPTSGAEAAQPRTSSAAGQEGEIARLTRELAEARQEQAATADVLRIVSSSGSLERVFETILENATRICEAKFGTLFRFDGKHYCPAAQFNTPAALLEAQTERGSFGPTSGSPFDYVMRKKQVYYRADNAAEPVARRGMATRLAGARSLIAVPMLKNDSLIGVILIYRQEVRPFTDQQIALVQNFAAQAVIAIENTRLLNELRGRTQELTEALEQRTAMSEVLGVISSAPGELASVFDTILANALRLCDAVVKAGALSIAAMRGGRPSMHSPCASAGHGGQRLMAVPPRRWNRRSLFRLPI